MNLPENPTRDDFKHVALELYKWAFWISNSAPTQGLRDDAVTVSDKALILLRELMTEDEWRNWVKEKPQSGPLVEQLKRLGLYP
jgi:hypothetical protein